MKPRAFKLNRNLILTDAKVCSLPKDTILYSYWGYTGTITFGMVALTLDPEGKGDFLEIPEDSFEQIS